MSQKNEKNQEPADVCENNQRPEDQWQAGQIKIETLHGLELDSPSVVLRPFRLQDKNELYRLTRQRLQACCRTGI